MKSVQESILEGLKTKRIDEAYGQYGKYTRDITRIVVALVDYLNSRPFNTQERNIRAKVTFDPSCIEVTQRRTSLVFTFSFINKENVKLEAIGHDGKVVLNPHFTSEKLALFTYDIEAGVCRLVKNGGGIDYTAEEIFPVIYGMFNHSLLLCNYILAGYLYSLNIYNKLKMPQEQLDSCIDQAIEKFKDVLKAGGRRIQPATEPKVRLDIYIPFIEDDNNDITNLEDRVLDPFIDTLSGLTKSDVEISDCVQM
jgi:hypothetical protein